MTTLTASSQLTDGCDAAMANAIDRLIRISTAVAVVAVASVAAYVSYWHAYAVVRTHGESGLTARLEPATIDGLVYASSMVVLYAARHRVPIPSLARWLLGLGIAATLTANMAQGWSHGLVGAVVAAWPAGRLYPNGMEGVRGSNPLSSTQVRGRFRSWNWPLLFLRQQQTAATIMRASH